MIKRQIHCFSDCLSYALEIDGRFDYRPVYLGVWEYPFHVHEEGITYYGNHIKLDTVIRDIEDVYGRSIYNWFEFDKSKLQNFAVMEREVDCQSTAVITMIDLYYLPYSQHYQKKHYPHLVLVQSRSEGKWLVADPYFGWSGEVQDDIMRQSFGCNDLHFGVSIYLNEMHEPVKEKISQQFLRYDNRSASLFTIEVERFIRKMMSPQGKHMWKDVQHRLEDVGVISKRFYGYGQMISFFTEGGDISDDLNKVTELVKKWENFMLALFRFSILGKGESALFEKLEIIAAAELSIKQTLRECYEQWRKVHEGSLGR